MKSFYFLRKKKINSHSNFTAFLPQHLSGKDNVFDFVTTGGLCNRMRSISSAISLAKDINKKLTVVWFKDFECNCSFFDLFEPIENVTILEHDANNIFHSVYKHRTFFQIHFATLYDRALTIEDIRELNSTRYNYLEMVNYSSILACTGGVFHVFPPQFTNFKPILICQEKIESMVQEFNNNTIGVHIRRTDHKKAIEKSPTPLFVKAMQDELTKNPSTLFFLATDDPNEEDFIRLTFPGKILTFPKRSLSRNKAESIQDALVDLMCLARTKKIIGSYYSSFSKTAEQLGKIPLHVPHINNC